MKSLSTYQRRALTVFLIINLSVLAVSLIYTFLMNHLTDIGAFECKFKELYHLYCPGCGGSRSVKHLLRFDFFSAFLSYPPMAIMLFFFMCIDLRALLSIIRNNKKLLTDFNLNWLISLPIVILLNFFFRNILLIYFGIDYLGDII